MASGPRGLAWVPSMSRRVSPEVELWCLPHLGHQLSPMTDSLDAVITCLKKR